MGAGGRGGAGLYAGGCCAGEVVYYPQNATIAGNYDKTIDIDSVTTTDRISSIKKAGVNQLQALGGGDGAYWNNELQVERVYPPKAYTTTTTRSSTTLIGRSS